MTQKMKFAVEDIQLVDENIDRSQFSLLRVDAFATGVSAHNTFITEETLRKTAKTIIQKPFVFAIDRRTDDLGGHDKSEVAGGFVPHDSPLEFKQLPDGRIMLSCNVLVWKRYSGKLVDYFKRDGGKKSVSVEIEIFESEERDNGLLEILDFCYNAITALGTFIAPAIDGAQAVMQFSKEFNEAKEEYEFFSRYEEVDMTIPEEVKQNAQRALETYREGGGKASSVAIANARFLVKSEKMTPQRMRQLHKTLHGKKEMDEMTMNLWGGTASKEWSDSVVQLMDEIDVEQSKFYSQKEEGEIMPYQSLKDANPAIRGINPPVTLAQANQIAKQAEAVGTDEKINGWAVAISSFKKTHVVKDGHWVAKQSMSEDSPAIQENEDTRSATYGDDDSKEKQEEVSNMAEDKNKKPVEGSPEEEKQETVAEEKKEQEEGKGDMSAEKEEMMADAGDEKKEDKPADSQAYSLNEYLDVAALLEFLKAETASYAGMAELQNVNFSINDIITEIAKGKDANLKSVTSRMISHLQTSSKLMLSAMKDLKKFSEENEALKKFKSDTETERKNFEVKMVLKEAFEAGMPDEQLKACEAEAKNFSLENIDQYKNMVKARAFQYFGQRKVNEDDGIVRMAFPFVEKKNNEPVLWK